MSIQVINENTPRGISSWNHSCILNSSYEAHWLEGSCPARSLTYSHSWVSLLLQPPDHLLGLHVVAQLLLATRNQGLYLPRVQVQVLGKKMCGESNMCDQFLTSNKEWMNRRDMKLRLGQRLSRLEEKMWDNCGRWEVALTWNTLQATEKVCLDVHLIWQPLDSAVMSQQLISVI